MIAHRSEKDSFEPSPAMVKFLQAYTDETVRPTVKSLCQAAKIARSTFYDWSKLPGFSEWLHERAAEIAGDRLARLYQTLFQKASEGSVSAIRLFFERFDPDYAPRKDIRSHNLIEDVKDFERRELEREGERPTLSIDEELRRLLNRSGGNGGHHEEPGDASTGDPGNDGTETTDPGVGGDERHE